MSSGNCRSYNLKYPNKDGVELSCKYDSGKKRVNINLEVICGYLTMYSHIIVINIQNKL